ncbi:ras and ef-hand domain-containing protein [Anaeramoeba ignava]|uniref:Ras and ef-hand domain-containing protein n=1 Tax=Anaeramoeba ignava TaxID=1746090 RepID=A0A9Q0R4A9_ANAIG|nr:ras and ef-hand domain-containing protein [Anaeramoeba ignava]
MESLKLVLIGNSQVGKTSLLFQFCEGKFQPTTISTTGVDFRFATIYYKGEAIKLQIWDTAGQERFRTITSSYYRDCDGVIFIYDISNFSSFQQLSYWIKSVNENAPPNVSKMILGNKSDLENRKNVPTRDAKELATSLGAFFFEVSAKSGDNVEPAFQAFSQFIYQK